MAKRAKKPKMSVIARIEALGDQKGPQTQNGSENPPWGGEGPRPRSDDEHPLPLSEKTETPSTPPPPSPATMQDAYELFVEAYKDDPVAFVEIVLGAKPLQWQKEFLSSIASGERRISVRAGHGVGKSTACS